MPRMHDHLTVTLGDPKQYKEHIENRSFWLFVATYLVVMTSCMVTYIVYCAGYGHAANQNWVAGVLFGPLLPAITVGVVHYCYKMWWHVGV